MSVFDLEALRGGIADVLSGECGSRALHAFVDGAPGLEEQLWGQAAALGWLAIGLPEDVGGLGLGAAGLDVLHFELGRRLAPGPYVATLAAAQWLAELGVGQPYCEAVAGGGLKIAVPAEPSEARRLTVEGDALHGRSSLLLGSAASGLAVVPVRTAAGDGWGLVEVGAEARLERQPMWDLTRDLCVLTCEAAPAAAIIEDAGGRALAALERHLSLAVASDSVGAGLAIAGQTVEYLKTRVQFGRPIGSFQALKHRAADMMILLETNRHLVDQAVETDGGLSGDLWAALAKASAAEAFRQVAADCVQLHGGIGFTWEYDCHLYLKRARLNEMLVGGEGGRRDLASARLEAILACGQSAAELAA